MFIAAGPFGRKERWSWNCIAASVTRWFAVDTATSLAFKVGINAVFNTVVLLAIGLTLLFTPRQFKREHSVITRCPQQISPSRG